MYLPVQAKVALGVGRRSFFSPQKTDLCGLFSWILPNAKIELQVSTTLNLYSNPIQRLELGETRDQETTDYILGHSKGKDNIPNYEETSVNAAPFGVAVELSMDTFEELSL